LRSESSNKVSAAQLDEMNRMASKKFKFGSKKFSSKNGPPQKYYPRTMYLRHRSG